MPTTDGRGFGHGSLLVSPVFFFPYKQVQQINGQVNRMVETNNRVTFQCYFSIAESFDGIFSKLWYFNATDPI